MQFSTDRTFKTAAVVVALLAVASFGIAVFLPLYTDEIIWKVMQGRLGYDALQVTRTLITCGPYAIPIPAVLRPFGWVDTLIYQDLADPLGIRVIGVVLALGWGCLTWWLLRWRLAGAVPSWTIAAAILAFSTLGVMPFLLVVNRPEQILRIAITLLLIPLLTDVEPKRRHIAADVGLVVPFVLLAGYGLWSHPRTLFAIPLMVLFAFCVFARRSVAILTCSGVLTLAMISFLFWSARFACDNPAHHEFFLADNIVYAAQKGELVNYLRLEWWGLYRHPVNFLASIAYLKQFQFQGGYTSDMIPATESLLRKPLAVATAGSFGVLLVAGACAYALLLWNFVRTRTGAAAVLALGSTWGFYAFSAAARVYKNAYEETLMEPLMVLLALGSIWAARHLITAHLGEARLRRGLLGGFAAVLLLSIVNQLVFLSEYAPHVATWVKPGYSPGQKFSVSVFGFQSLRPKILETAALCGIDPASHPRRVVVDELTYFALEPVSEPVFTTYIDEHGWGRSIEDIGRMLTDMHSAGVVVGCQWLPSKLKHAAIRNDPFCCVPGFH